jgi:coenzyme F420 hydrogenase subunit beta
MNPVDKIIKSQLCLGCGLCETICTSQKCSMILERGFYTPKFESSITEQEIKNIIQCCPGIHVESKDKIRNVWGNVFNIKEAWAMDEDVRKKASSGGVISAIAIHLLAVKQVDAILHAGVVDTSFLHNELKISRTKEEILKNIGSRYAPALMFQKLQKVLDDSKEIFAIIGKPCDIAAIKNFLTVFPQYSNRFIYFLTIFCAGMPSYEGTRKLLELSNNKEEPYFLKYRGDGWPGFFEAKYRDGQIFKMSYNDSWGKILGKYLGFRCKICPDGIGLLADIAVGDSWNTKDGYPDFEENDGRNFVLLRTNKGIELFNSAIQNHAIIAHELGLDRIEEMQDYQYQRRLLAAYRIIPIQLLTGILKFKKLGIYNLLLKANVKAGIKNMLGTLRRFIKILLKT